MADAAKASVMTTTVASGGTGAALILAQYLASPSWPPPEPVLIIAVTALAPFLHVVGRAFSRWLNRAVGEDLPTPTP